ncbi:family 43 glycosylhydrolase [Niabella hibiscisoli]|uniref:family 43 glycosylhydrolase n=1 Tax=Niabella hibiscisoli TaxID=1825928 RepID=UPI001F0F163F|nr:family 43 glycosylhydrolase [Niabella hibiscisoli]MCH5719472.1 family 43 glycosylhydrolase [Niabella hibiscisoli]
MVTVLACSGIWSAVLAQAPSPSRHQAQFSDPFAPVGNKALTVPGSVTPVLDIWMRDTYVMKGPDNFYYLTGTTATPGRHFTGEKHCWDHNDGLYLWRSRDLKKWESKGLVWSFAKDAAAWQKRKAGKAGARSVNGDPLDSIFRAVWAPELHYIKSQKKWLLIACLNGGGGSFVLESISGKPEGPYQNIPGNKDKAIFANIDLGAFEDDNGDVYLVGHNHYIAKMKPDLSDIAQPFQLFKETPYDPEPYIEGATISKHHNKYQLLQTVWSVAREDGSYTYTGNAGGSKKVHSYDVVVAEADNIYGPYSPRYPAILEGGIIIFSRMRRCLVVDHFFNPRGVMGKRFQVTCRPALVPVKWQSGRLMPDVERVRKSYKAVQR